MPGEPWASAAEQTCLHDSGFYKNPESSAQLQYMHWLCCATLCDRTTGRVLLCSAARAHSLTCAMDWAAAQHAGLQGCRAGASPAQALITLSETSCVAGHSIMCSSKRPDSRQAESAAHLAWDVCLCMSMDVFMPAASVVFAIWDCGLNNLKRTKRHPCHSEA